MSDRHTFFLVIEGLDGSGKSEISRRLAELMRATLDDRVMLTFEPHDPSAAGLYIRRVLRKKILVSSHTLALAFALNRADHNERVIGPFLEQNSGPRLVMCDRYVLSSLVYNTSHDLPMQAVWDLNSGARRPDLTLFLDASAEICYARMGSRGGNRELFESNLAESRAHYFDAIAFLRQHGEQVMVVDANHDLLTVINSIIDVLKAAGPRWLTLQKLMFLEATAPALVAPPPLELDRWMRDFVDRYSAPVLAEAELDDGVRRLVANEVNSLSLDELTALMMNFLQVDRRYRFESAWPGQPLDYTIIRPGGETGGLVILQDERRWEGVMRALESEFIAPHYSIRSDSIQFVVALDPSHAGEEVAQFVPDTGSVPVEVYGRGTLIQYFTRYITRRVMSEHAWASQPPQLSMPLPEGDPLTDDWSLAVAAVSATISEEAPPAPEPPPVAPHSRTATQEMWLVQQDYVPAPEEYLPVASGYYQEQEGEEPSVEPLAEVGSGEDDAGPIFEPPVMDYDTGGLAALTEEAAPPPPEAEMPWAMPNEPAAYSPEADEYAFVPPPEAEMPWAAPAESAAPYLAGQDEYAFVPPPEAEMPWDTAGTAAPADMVEVDAESYAFVPPPEAELPLTPAGIDTGEDVYLAENGFAPPEINASEELPPSKWDTREDIAALHLDYNEDEEPFSAAEAPAAPEVAYDHDFSFDMAAHEGDPLAEIYAATAVTQAEMDAIAALYRGLNEPHRTRHDEPDAAQDEEMG